MKSTSNDAERESGACRHGMWLEMSEGKERNHIWGDDQEFGGTSDVSGWAFRLWQTFAFSNSSALYKVDCCRNVQRMIRRMHGIPQACDRHDLDT